MSEESVVINDTEILPGQRKRVNIPLSSLYDCSPLSMPVHVIRGKKPGPTLCVTAAIHGDEINGVEIVRRLLAKKGLTSLRGTLIAVPVVNVYGFLIKDRYLPDRRDLNRCFPGSPNGSMGARLAHIISSQVLSNVDVHIDLHSGSFHRSNLPQIRINGDGEEECRLARAFNAPVVLMAKEREGTIRQMAHQKGIHALLYEAGEAYRFDELSIRLGVRGILNVMHEMGMLVSKKNIAPSDVSRSFFTCSSFWVRSLHSGIFTSRKMLGKKVEKGEVIARVGNPFSGHEHNILSPLSGIVIGLNELPLVQEGAALLHIASFEKLAQVEEKLEEFISIYPDNEYFDIRTHLSDGYPGPHDE